MAPVIIIEYRRHKGDETWLRSAMEWSHTDVLFFNKICGYTKYRSRMSS